MPVKPQGLLYIGRGRVILLEVECDLVNYCIVNLYAPNYDDVDFIKIVFLETLGRARDDFIIVAGDWNTVLNNDLDKMGGAQAHASKKTKILLITYLGFKSDLSYVTLTIQGSSITPGKGFWKFNNSRLPPLE